MKGTICILAVVTMASVVLNPILSSRTMAAEEMSADGTLGALEMYCHGLQCASCGDEHTNVCPTYGSTCTGTTSGCLFFSDTYGEPDHCAYTWACTGGCNGSNMGQCTGCVA